MSVNDKSGNVITIDQLHDRSRRIKEIEARFFEEQIWDRASAKDEKPRYVTICYLPSYHMNLEQFTEALNAVFKKIGSTPNDLQITQHDRSLLIELNADTSFEAINKLKLPPREVPSLLPVKPAATIISGPPPAVAMPKYLSESELKQDFLKSIAQGDILYGRNILVNIVL